VLPSMFILLALSLAYVRFGSLMRLTLGHETQSAEYGKVDPGQGLQFDLGPGHIRYLAATLRQRFANGSFQATFEQADARLLNTSYSIVPEAPRLIGDLLGMYQKLPFQLQVNLSSDPNALNY
jgi:hypothetical protein